MCYDDDYIASTCAVRMVCYGVDNQLDCGNDDRFDPLPEPGETLRTTWNVGGESNRFITRSAMVPPAPR